MRGTIHVACGGVQLLHVQGKVAELNVHGAHPNVFLSVESFSSAMLKNVPDVLVDLLEMAAYVFTADQMFSRGDRFDLGERWRRSFHFYIPVRAPKLWRRPEVLKALREALGFAADEQYDFTFSQLKREEPIQQYLDGDFQKTFEIDEVLLFSGGLDSLAGAIREVLEGDKRILLVSHDGSSKRHPRVAALLPELGKLAPGRFHHAFIKCGKRNEDDREVTQRTRSFLYASLAFVFARMLGLKRIRFSENGLTSFNLPISEQVVGARASRTTHPRTLRLYQVFFEALIGEEFRVENPFIWNTKSDIVRIVRNAGCGSLIVSVHQDQRFA